MKGGGRGGGEREVGGEGVGRGRWEERVEVGRGEEGRRRG